MELNKMREEIRVSMVTLSDLMTENERLKKEIKSASNVEVNDALRKQLGILGALNDDHDIALQTLRSVINQYVHKLENVEAFVVKQQQEIERQNVVILAYQESE
eukprot:805996_1